MMKPFLLSLGLAAVASAAVAAAAPIEVSQAWSRPATGANGAGFLLLTNHGRTPEALVAAESPVADRVEVHRTTIQGGMAAMQRQDSVVVPAGGSVAFAPGGYHLMIMGLKRPLQAGDKFPMTLRFASGAKVAATFVVSVTPPPAAKP